ncbi:MAG: methylisocitrate lyase [Deltaproteobacteria bacterium]|nr:MAG: methylisocitrate lyase [Deltaproteobacteria bacterium]RLC17070.1 MAG: methylisocitrate lyase [Deltaproteobacteria bacterium]
MLFPNKNIEQKRADLRSALVSGRLLRFPGAFSPIVSMLIEKMDFEGVYVSGAVLAADLGLPDIGLTTLIEVAARGRAIARVTSLPTIIDMDTGFGEILNVVRTIQELEEMGLCGAHIEDQLNPKRCGHLDNKILVDKHSMVQKIQAAVCAKSDPNFIIIARTDACAVEGLDKAIDRAKSYVDAGADVIFPEALNNLKDFERFRKEIAIPLMANMTEFGKSELLEYSQLQNVGYNIVIYPVTAFRLALKAVEEGLSILDETGTQVDVLDRMQHRKELYELLRYKDYNRFDKDIYNFDL